MMATPENERQCYFCHEVIHKAAHGCPHCGKNQSFVIRFWKLVLRIILWVGFLLIVLFVLWLVLFMIIHR